MLEAPKHYLHALRRQPFFEGKTGDEALLHVSLEKPLSQWLGNYRRGVKERAIALGIWDQIFTGGVDVQEVISDGFEKEAIGIELKRRRIEKIQQQCEA